MANPLQLIAIQNAGGSIVPVSATNPIPTIGGGGGGGAVTLADGADVVQGATTDAAVTTNTTGTLSGKLRGLVAILADIWDSVNHRIKVDGSGVTQPVSLASAPSTPVTNASLANLDVALSTRTKPADQQHTIIDSATLGTVAVSGTFFQPTQPVSAVALPLPANAVQETGGNLAAIYALTLQQNMIVDLLQQVVSRLDAINLNLSHTNNLFVDPNDFLNASSTIQ